LVSEEIVRRAMTARGERRQPEKYAAYRQGEVLHEYLSSLREQVSLWVRSFTIDPKTIAATLGGTVTDTRGSSDGTQRLEGSALREQMAANVSA
jgi:hypothetical protein